MRTRSRSLHSSGTGPPPADRLLGASAPQDARYALVANPVALGPHGVGDRPQCLPLRPQALHFADRLLLALVGDELAGLADAVAERRGPAEVAPASLLVGLHLPDPLADAVALGLGEGGGDRQEQLRQAVARNVAAKVEEVKGDAALP